MVKEFLVERRRGGFEDDSEKLMVLGSGFWAGQKVSFAEKIDRNKE